MSGNKPKKDRKEKSRKYKPGELEIGDPETGNDEPKKKAHEEKIIKVKVDPSHRGENGGGAREEPKWELSRRTLALRAEQRIAGLAGGKTGLLMYFYKLLSDAEAGDLSSFEFYATAYKIKYVSFGREMKGYRSLLDPTPGDTQTLADKLPSATEKKENILKKLWGNMEVDWFSRTVSITSKPKQKQNSREFQEEAKPPEERSDGETPAPSSFMPQYELLEKVGESLKRFPDHDAVTEEAVRTWGKEFRPLLRALEGEPDETDEPGEPDGSDQKE